jgi:hypothetical protein
MSPDLDFCPNEAMLTPRRSTEVAKQCSVIVGTYSLPFGHLREATGMIAIARMMGVGPISDEAY